MQISAISTQNSEKKISKYRRYADFADHLFRGISKSLFSLLEQLNTIQKNTISFVQVEPGKLHENNITKQI